MFKGKSGWKNCWLRRSGIQDLGGRSVTKLQLVNRFNLLLTTLRLAKKQGCYRQVKSLNVNVI